MKRSLLTFAIVGLLTACNSNPKTNETTTTKTTTVDTAGFNHNAAADKGQVIQLKGVNDTIFTGDGSRYVKVDPNAPKPAAAESNSATATTAAPVARSTN